MKSFKEFVEESNNRGDTEYQKFFRSVLKKYGVESPDELSDEKRKEFFDYVDDNWEAEDE